MQLISCTPIFNLIMVLDGIRTNRHKMKLMKTFGVHILNKFALSSKIYYGTDNCTNSTLHSKTHLFAVILLFNSKHRVFSVLLVLSLHPFVTNPN